MSHVSQSLDCSCRLLDTDNPALQIVPISFKCSARSATLWLKIELKLMILPIAYLTRVKAFEPFPRHKPRLSIDLTEEKKASVRLPARESRKSGTNDYPINF